MTPSAAQLRPVQLRGLPIEEYLASEDRLAVLLGAAERAAAAEDVGAAPSSMALTVRALIDDYADVRMVSDEAIAAAQAEGATTLDLSLELPLTAASAAETWVHLIEHLDDLARAGSLPVDPAPEGDRRLRRWLTEELVRQFARGRRRSPVQQLARVCGWQAGECLEP